MSTSRTPAGLVAPDLEAPVGEVHVAPHHSAGRRGTAAAQQERRDRRSPPGGLRAGCFQVRPVVLYVQHGVATVELAGCLEHDRDLLGAVQVDRARLGDLQLAALADRGVARDVALVDSDRKGFVSADRCAC